jgi:hypothetical protein
MHVRYEKCYSIIVDKPDMKCSLGRHKGRYIKMDLIIIIFIYCNWVVTRWQWFFNTNTKHEIRFLLNLHQEGYMRSM